jgi:hypothetical protein
MQAAKRTFRLTAAKRKSLQILTEYFCLRVCDVAGLIHNHEPDNNDLRTARRTLLLLWKEGLLHREPYIELERERGSVCYVYGLSDKGIEDPYGDFDHLRFIKTFDEHSSRTLDHELEISWFHITVKCLCGIHGWRLYWQQADLKTKSIHPDAYFAITDPRRPEGKNTHHFFLEIERSKFSNYGNGEPSILRKLGKYYDLFDSPECEREWGIRHFRVIIVQRTEVRRTNLLHALREKHNHPMFWLTTEERYKRDIGGEIFKMPRDWKTVSYSFVSLA